jgi:hypothetical protein
MEMTEIHTHFVNMSWNPQATQLRTTVLAFWLWMEELFALVHPLPIELLLL